MIHLVAVGACYLDTILDVPYYPQEDEKLRATTLTKRRGGNCPNTLEVLQELLHSRSNSHDTSSSGRDPEVQDVKLNLVSVLPRRSSPAVQTIHQSLLPDDGRTPLVSLERCIFRDDHEEPASAFIVRSEATGSRTSVNYNVLPEMAIEEFKVVVDSFGEDREVGEVDEGKRLWFHFEGRIPETTLQCMKYIREIYPQARISVEIEKPGRQGLRDLVPVADLVFFSRGWAQAEGYEDYEECVRDQARLASRAIVLCCTWGQSGAAAIEPVSGTYIYSRAWSSEQPCTVDTIGAGDTFIAGVLYAYMLHEKDWSLTGKLDFANAVAGRKVVQEGFRGLGTSMSTIHTDRDSICRNSVVARDRLL